MAQIGSFVLCFVSMGVVVVWTMDHFGHDQIRFSAVTAAAAAALLPR